MAVLTHTVRPANERLWDALLNTWTAESRTAGMSTINLLIAHVIA